MSSPVSNVRPAPDRIMVDVADYAAGYIPESKEALDTARYCLMDTLGCALHGVTTPEARRLAA